METWLTVRYHVLGPGGLSVLSVARGVCVLLASRPREPARRKSPPRLASSGGRGHASASDPAGTRLPQNEEGMRDLLLVGMHARSAHADSDADESGGGGGDHRCVCVCMCVCVCVVGVVLCEVRERHPPHPSGATAVAGGAPPLVLGVLPPPPGGAGAGAAPPPSDGGAPPPPWCWCWWWWWCCWCWWSSPPPLVPMLLVLLSPLVLVVVLVVVLLVLFPPPWWCWCWWSTDNISPLEQQPPCRGFAHGCPRGGLLCVCVCVCGGGGIMQVNKRGAGGRQVGLKCADIHIVSIMCRPLQPV